MTIFGQELIMRRLSTRRAFTLATALIVAVIVACTALGLLDGSARTRLSQMRKPVGPPPAWLPAFTAVPKSVPKLLHQMFGSELVYSAYRPFIQSCLRLNPDWKYYVWTEKDTNLLVEQFYPQLKRIFRLMKRLEKSDVTRYIVLHKFGGVYLDMDMECRLPLKTGSVNYTAFVGQEAILQTKILYDQPFMAMNGAMGSMPGHPFFKRLIDRIAMGTEFGDLENVMASTGPSLLTEELLAYWNESATGGRYNASSAGLQQQQVAMAQPHHFLPLMDDDVKWRITCFPWWIRKSDGPDKKAGCAELSKRNWVLPNNTQPDTICTHRWIHLAQSTQALSRFNARVDFKDRINFYRDELH